MPIVAVASIAGGASALAAGGLTAFGTIAAIGSIVGGIGALTGNKELAMLGGIAGLAGGIGAFAQGQGWLASGSSASAMGDAAMSNTQALMNTPAPGLENAVQDFSVGNAVEMGQGLAGEGALIEGGIQSSIVQPATQAMGNTGGLFGANLADSASTLTGGVNPLARDAYGLNTGSSLATTTGPDSGVLGTLKKFGRFMEENKQLSSFAANFIGGALDDRKKAETDLLKARTREIDQRLKNANDVPRLNPRLRSTGPLFPTTAPTYNPVRTGALFTAR